MIKLFIIIIIIILFNILIINEKFEKNNKKIICSDLDKTILNVDITEGTKNFKSIIEYLYDRNLVKSTIYPTYKDFRNEYNKRILLNNSTAYILPYDIYNKSQDEYIKKYWNYEIIKHFNKNVLNLLNDKIKNGFKLWIISASPLVFINPLSKYIEIDKIIAIEPNKIINYGEGKIKRLEKYVGKNLNNVYGFIGDSWSNDGPLMMKLKNLNENSFVKFIKTENNLDKNIKKSLKRFSIQLI